MPSMPDTCGPDQGSSNRTICNKLTLAIRRMGDGCHQAYRATGIEWTSIYLSSYRLLYQMGESNFSQSVTKKVVADFIKNNLICRFGVPKSIITYNGANLNNHLMKDICKHFKITHRNSTVYKPQMNGALPYALLGYRTTTRTSTGDTPYLLVYGTKAVIPAEVEIPSLRIIQEAELNDAEWVRYRYEQLAMIDEKRMVAVCHGQLYRQRISRAFNKQVRAPLFQIGQLVLKRVLLHQDEYKGKFAPNWQGPYMARKVLSGGAVVLAEMDGQERPKAINADALKRYYV
ncbi:uncharacterized protein LOC132644119 [Lycium barbarum]|uniref:uncharacterized protein LOC132644119 n=1 Tax=Lycium barbarum TaxID=112863 RepID=UPI00293F3229|nr:uncharacterized protein LOC132644119 [Lycium barbarum]